MTIDRGLPDQWFPDLPPTEDPQAAQERGRIEHAMTTAMRQGKMLEVEKPYWRGQLEADFHEASAALAARKPVVS